MYFPRLHAASLALALSLAGCQPTNSHESAAGAGEVAVRVTPIKPARKNLVRVIEVPGRAEAHEVAPLYAKVTGYVDKIPVDIGDAVTGPHGDEPGTLLCELMVPELKEERAEKRAHVARAQADILQADAGIKVAEAAVRSFEAKVREAQSSLEKEDAQVVRWKSQYERIAMLTESGSVNKKVAEETKAEYETAEARRKEAQSRIESADALRNEALALVEKAKADAASVRARLAVCEAELRRVEATLDFSVLRAPFDGVVVERNVHTGHLVQAGGAGTSKKPIVSIMRINPIRVVFDVPETDAVHVQKGTKAELRVTSLPDPPHVVTVTRTSWSLNTTSRALSAEVDVPNSSKRWRVGLYVQVKLTVAEVENALSLPKSAIVTHDKQSACYVVEADGKITRRPLRLGLQAGTDFEVLEGLTGEEQVIGLNVNAFREGQIVEIVPAAK